MKAGEREDGGEREAGHVGRDMLRFTRMSIGDCEKASIELMVKTAALPSHPSSTLSTNTSSSCPLSCDVARPFLSGSGSWLTFSVFWERKTK